MSNLSTLLAGATTATDPRKEGLPLFGLFGQNSDQNHHLNYRIFDSNFKQVNTPWGAVCNTTTNYRFGMLGDASHAYWGSDHSTNIGHANLTTEGWTSWTAWNKSIYQIDQYPHAQYYTSSRNGAISWHSYHNISSSFECQNGWTKLNMVLPEGIRPRRIFCNRRFSLREMSGLHGTANFDHYDYTPHLLKTDQTYATGTGYNEKMKMLVMVHSGDEGANTSKTIHIFRSKKDLNACTKIKEFFDDLISTEYFTDTWTNQSVKDWCVVVGNNGWVGFGLKQGNSKRYCAFDCNVKGVGIDITGASRRYLDWQTFSGSTTTSYGAWSRHQYYTKFQTTWDGTWGMIYSPYYYYGPGINAFAMSLENPRKFISLSQTHTDYPNPYIAWGRTGFHGGCSHNTDSTTWRTFAFAFDPSDSDHEEDTRVYMGGSSNDTVIPNSNSHAGGTYTNKTGVCSLSECYTNLHGGYYSTCYPGMFGINWWGTYGAGDASYGGK